MNAPGSSSGRTIWCTEVDLADGLRHVTAPDSMAAAEEARVLVRLHGESIEFVQLPVADRTISVESIIDRLTGVARQRLDAHLIDDGVGLTASLSDSARPFACRRPSTSGPRVSVVVCTRNRGPALRDCLAQLQQLRYDDLEIVIVDNAPSDDVTKRTFESQVGGDVRFRYVLEARQGLSRARNRGLDEVSGEIIAYTDDDVKVDPGWITGLISGFQRRSDVGCVTSLVCTASLNTPAEHYFDGKVSWATSCTPQVYDLHTPSVDPMYPFAPGLFGTGAGMAFRVSTLRAMGGFDEALGAGTRTAGGEDLDIFVRMLRGGHALVYEPSSVVWHHHRSDIEGLRRQMFGYGSGLTAYVTKHLLDRSSRRDLVRRIPRGVAHMTTVARKSQKSGSPADSIPSRSLLLRELAGMAAGPFLYAAARRDVAATLPARPIDVVTAA